MALARRGHPPHALATDSLLDAEWYAEALTARDAYRGEPSLANRDRLSRALRVLRALGTGGDAATVDAALDGGSPPVVWDGHRWQRTDIDREVLP